MPWLPQRGELATESTERGNGNASIDSIIPLSGPVGHLSPGGRGKGSVALHPMPLRR